MAKIKAVLDQETWIAVDVPEEFQAIVLSLSSTDFPVKGMEMPSNDNNSKLSEDGVFTSQESHIQLKIMLKIAMGHLRQAMKTRLNPLLRLKIVLLAMLGQSRKPLCLEVLAIIW